MKGKPRSRGPPRPFWGCKPLNFHGVADLIKNDLDNQEKLKMSKFPLKASVQKSEQNFFAKILQSAGYSYRLSKKL